MCKTKGLSKAQKLIFLLKTKPTFTKQGLSIKVVFKR